VEAWISDIGDALIASNLEHSFQQAVAKFVVGDAWIKVVPILAEPDVARSLMPTVGVLTAGVLPFVAHDPRADSFAYELRRSLAKRSGALVRCWGGS
jgi:hypothetical protein